MLKSFSLSVSDFNLAHTLECGQVFRWDRAGPNEYSGIAHRAQIRIKQANSRLYVKTSDPCITPSFIRSYFDLTLDLAYIYNTICKDKHIKAAIERFRGLRIIRQPLWECLASFIISTRNNIPRIKGIISRLAGCFGERIGSNGVAGYSFPDAQALAGSSTCRLRDCGAGYRDRYLKKAARDFLKKGLDTAILRKYTYETARETLLQFPGVGPKVADCALLYSAGKFEAFPVDVWIKRIMERFYFGGRETDENTLREFARGYFGEYAGYAQQYLYHYGRNITNNTRRE